LRDHAVPQGRAAELQSWMALDEKAAWFLAFSEGGSQDSA